MRFWGKIINFLRIFPVWGGIVDCRRPKDYWNAAAEVFTIIIVSTSPLWLSAFGMITIDKSDEIEYLKALGMVTNGGELFLYTTSILAPIFYMVLRKGDIKKGFPNRLSHIIIIFIITIISAYFFGLKRSGSEIDTNLISNISRIAFFLSAILLYTAILYNNNRLSTSAEDVKAKERDFNIRYKKHRGES